MANCEMVVLQHKDIIALFLEKGSFQQVLLSL